MDIVTFSPPLSENAAGNVNSLVSGYLSLLRKFRLFLDSDGTADPSALKQKKTSNRVYTRRRKWMLMFLIHRSSGLSFIL